MAARIRADQSREGDGEAGAARRLVVAGVTGAVLRGAASVHPEVTEQRKPIRPSAEAKRAVGYLRVSTAGQAERGMSLAAQREQITDYARGCGYALIDVVSEAASGGRRNDEVLSTEHRPALEELIQRAKRGEFDVLIVARLDRLSRDHTTLVVTERRLQLAKVEVESVAEKNGDGPLAKWMRDQLGMLAELERQLILERVNAGKAQKKKKGRHVHGRVPYGYTTNEPGILVPNQPPAAIVARIFNDIRAGESPGRIARALNAEKIAPPQPRGTDAAGWLPRSVRLIASNPVYTGERYGVKKAHPPIISRRVFNEANRILDERATAWATKHTRRAT